MKGDVLNRIIGEEIEVVCKDRMKTLSKDIWDQNSSDNALHIRCKSNQIFDAPLTQDLPLCLAKCQTKFPKAFPVLPEDIVPLMETDSGSEINENEKIW